MEHMTEEKYRALAEAGETIPASPEAIPLEVKHSEMDVLNACPRVLTIGGVTITSKALKGGRYEELVMLLASFGYESCETPEDVDAVTIDDLFANISFAVTIMQANARIASEESGKPYNPPLNGNSLTSYLFELMEFPEGETINPDEIEAEEFKAFLAILIEQNNIVKSCKQIKKKLLRNTSNPAL